jgi:hypothetical protein
LVYSHSQISAAIIEKLEKLVLLGLVELEERLFEPVIGVHFHQVDLMGIQINGKVKAESSSELFFPLQKVCKLHSIIGNTTADLQVQFLGGA